MATTDESRNEIPCTREEDDFPASTLQLRLAAGIVGRLVEQNGGRDAADVFWDDYMLDSLEDEGEYQDPELWDPNEETLPEANEIEWNLYPCN